MNAEEGTVELDSDEDSSGCGNGDFRKVASMDACSGASSEASMSEVVGVAACNDGSSDCGIENDARASHAAFSSSRLE